jgi:hypothetical protein
MHAHAYGGLEQCIQSEGDEGSATALRLSSKFLHLLDVRIKNRARRIGFLALGRANFQLCRQVEELFGAQPWDIRDTEFLCSAFFESFNIYPCCHLIHGCPPFQNSVVSVFLLVSCLKSIARVCSSSQFGSYEI